VISGAVLIYKKLREAPPSSLLNASTQPRPKWGLFVARTVLLGQLLLYYSEVFSSYLRNAGKATSDAYFHL
jgi:hypothetical protein